MWLPTRMVLVTTMILGILITISSNQWFMLWIGLELNMFAFLPILGSSRNKKEVSTAPLYLSIQAVASGLIIVSASLSMTSMNSWCDIIFQSAVLMKAGGPPAFCWYPNMLNSLSWPLVWLLMTVQKISPVVILSIASKLNHLVIIMAASMALIGGIGGILQTQLRGLLAYSSLTHLGWLLALSSETPSLALCYFTVYVTITTAIISILLPKNLKSHPNTANLSPTHKMTISMLLLSLAGVPPLLGFLPKLQAIQGLVTHNSFIIIIILISGSLMNLYFYLNLLLSTSTSLSPSMHLNPMNYTLSLPIVIIACMSLILFLPLIATLM
uniref:NADH-ubiquinone oxidoreductase chain 2 n=1 Tax=Orbinia latreillii TaxID=195264 RepID=Q1X8Y0_9ANNE|nr:NADH dehydrogenase subunit 2 [Orbinia latreillii]AAX50151.1 NADH dehydrogenase subunit 2 [Orbinia latreillii]